MTTRRDPAQQSSQSGTLVVAWLSLIIASVSAIFTGLTYWKDYEEAVIIAPGTLPLRAVYHGDPKTLNLKVANTSNSNMKYQLRVESNTFCVEGEDARPKLLPCNYETRVVQLSKPSAGSHEYTHKITLAAPERVEMNRLSYMSDPVHYLSVEVLSAPDGEPLFRSRCYYTFSAEKRGLVLYEPVLDTSGESDILQAECRG